MTTKSDDGWVRCVTCGVPMRDASDHAHGDPNQPYCRGCVKADGSIISYQEVLGHMAAHLIKTLDLHPEAARGIAEERLSKLPAWVGLFKKGL